MRVVLTTYGSRGDVEPMVALAVQLRAMGAQVRVCAPPDEEFAQLLTDAGVPMVPFARPWRSWVRPSTAEERTRRVAEFIDAQYDTVAAAAAECDLLLATGMSHFVAQTVAEQLAIPHRYVIFAPSVLTDLDAQNWNALFGPSINSHRVSIGLSPVADVREFMFTEQPWLAADPTLGPWQATAGLRVWQTGAWILPDVRPLSAELLAFLDAGTPPVYVGFGSMRGVPEDIARVAIEAVRAQGRRVVVGQGWAGLALVDGRDDCFVVGRGQPTGTVRPGGRRRTPRRSGYDDDRGPCRCASGGGAAGGWRPDVLGQSGGRAGHRHGARWSRSDHGVPVDRARDGPLPRDPRPSDCGGRLDPQGWGDGGRNEAAGRGQP